MTNVCCWKPTSPIALTLPRSTPSNSPKTLMLAGGGGVSLKPSYDIDRSRADGGGAAVPTPAGALATPGDGSLPPLSSNCCDDSLATAGEVTFPGSMCESCIPGSRKLVEQPVIATPIIAAIAAKAAAPSHLPRGELHLRLLLLSLVITTSLAPKGLDRADAIAKEASIGPYRLVPAAK